MRNAEQPQVDDEAIYTQIANIRKNNGNREAHNSKGLVFKLYREYFERLDSEDGPRPHGHSAPIQQALESNFTTLGNKPFEAFCTSILKSAGGKCAYCHLITAGEIDHFLPKTIFGEYSVLGANLTPICDKCNKRKSTRYSLEGRGRRYVHPYHDVLPESRFLTATVEVSSGVLVTFSLDVPTSTPERLQARMQQQFDDLKLAEKYSDEVVPLLIDHRETLCGEYEEDGATAVSSWLHKTGSSARSGKGENYWWAAALLALAESDEFCNGGFLLLPKMG